MLCKGVAVLAVHPHGLEEKEAEEPSSHEEHYVADHRAKEKLAEDYQTQAYELVASVAQELEEGWRGAASSEAEEVEAAFEQNGLEDPHEEGLGVDIAQDIRGKASHRVRAQGTYTWVLPM